MDDKFRSRKFILAMISMIAVIVGLFTATLEGGEFLGGITIILGLYGGANVLQSKQ